MPDPKRGGPPPPPDISHGRALEFLREVYHSKDSQPAIEEFSIHPDEQARDIELEKRLSKKYRFGGSESGALMEQMLSVELDRSDWFGGLVFRTTKYDDFKGVDAVIEWDMNDELGFVPRLAVDFTTSDQSELVEKKLEKLKHGGKVKYFRSDAEFDGDKEKEMSLEKLPMVVLGIDSSYIKRLGQVGMANKREKTVQGRRKVDIAPQTFAKHGLRLLLLEQAEVQIEAQIIRTAVNINRIVRRIGSPEAIAASDEYLERASTGRATPPELLDSLKSASQVLIELKAGLGDRRIDQSKSAEIDRWLSLGVIYDQIQAKLRQNEDANPRETDGMRRRSQTHKLLTMSA